MRVTRECDGKPRSYARTGTAEPSRVESRLVEEEKKACLSNERDGGGKGRSAATGDGGSEAIPVIENKRREHS